MVLHTTIIEDIASYLCAPFDLLLACFDFGLCPTPALELLVVELGAKQSHSVLSIVGLGACLGVLDDDLFLDSCLGIFVLVAKTHTSLDLVDILPTSTAGSEGVPTDIRWVDLYLDGVVYQGNYEDGGEARHALALGIVGGDTYEPVYSGLALEEAIGLVTFDLHGHGLDTGFFAILVMVVL